MSQLSSVLSAVAAAIAVIVSGVALVLTGRREHRKWLRDSLMDAYVDFLGASFNRGSGRARRLRLSNQAPDARALRSLQERASGVHADSNESLTRLRLIAPASVVKAAEQLHTADDDRWYAAAEATPVPNEDEWRRLQARQNEARERFLNEARHSIRLDRAAAITPYHGPYESPLFDSRS